MLPKIVAAGKVRKKSPRQMSLPWDRWDAMAAEIDAIASQFVLANCYDPRVASLQFFHWVDEGPPHSQTPAVPGKGTARER
ncbi:hypothetical protein [Oscillatoria acuminata]|uniref:hypothetical protein n=1 Tax=Oscillatoria acuminata TaxID=118323 RepID=UPI00031E3738|nr:hypothetical protein [Oscillatoria acuminata]